MRISPTLFNEHAVLITVISMQLIVVFGAGNYDIWDFVVSGLCFWFGLETFKIGYTDKLGRMLAATNIGISGTFFIVYAASFIFYFTLQWWFGGAPPFPRITSLPLTEHSISINPSGRYSETLRVGEVVALIAIIPAWIFCPKRR